ncbi:SIS domain-containing protein [Nocardioides sp. GXQ0305]|uniref:SIS domain-containing protein n=1 Tax=Nocardioides sp. GXQ0305 TaxID=3423912 RepID=UPI003D7E440B
MNSTNVVSGPGTHLASELTTQPEDWMTARDLAHEYADVLPQPGERVAFIGCGSSLYVSHSVAATRETAGLGETDAWPAGDAVLDRPYDRVVAISRSGTTTEVVHALERLDGRVPVTVITADPDSPAARLGEVCSLAFADERSVVQSRTATTAIALLRWHLGHDLTQASEQARAVLELDDDWFDPVRAAEQISFVGQGDAFGLAEEAALKLKESTQSWTDSWQQTEYRHGPISLASPGRAVWALGPLVPHFARDVAATGATFLHSGLDPLAELVKVHRLCVLRAADRDLDADQPRNLTRSIILEP